MVNKMQIRQLESKLDMERCPPRRARVKTRMFQGADEEKGKNAPVNDDVKHMQKCPTRDRMMDQTANWDHVAGRAERGGTKFQAESGWQS